jgi:hypothetical protein
MMTTAEFVGAAGIEVTEVEVKNGVRVKIDEAADEVENSGADIVARSKDPSTRLPLRKRTGTLAQDDK